MIGRMRPHKGNGAHASRLELTHGSSKFRIGRSRLRVGLGAVAVIAGAVRATFGTIVTICHRRISIRVGRRMFPLKIVVVYFIPTLVDSDLAFVTNVSILAGAVVAGFLVLEIEVIVLLSEVGSARGAGGSIFAVEAGYLGTDFEVEFY